MSIAATRTTRITRSTVVVALATATLAAVGLSATFADGTSETRTPTPDWFTPIAEHYDYNPAITPETDFAELHFGGLGS